MLRIKPNLIVLFYALFVLISCADTQDAEYENNGSEALDTNTENVPQNVNVQAATNVSETATIPRENGDNEQEYQVENEAQDNTNFPAPLEEVTNPILPGSGENAYLPEQNNNTDLTDDVIFASNFDSETQQCWSNRPNANGNWNFAGCGGFVNIGNGGSVSIAENEISRSGNKALKITFNVDEDYGGAEIDLIEADHIYTRYYDYYNTDFDFPYGMKIHRIRSFNEILQINNFDSTLLIAGRPSQGEFNYSGINDTAELTYGSNGGQVDWGSAVVPLTLTRNRWYCMEAEMKLNTPGQANGVTRAWIDGNLVIERTNLNIRGTNTGKINAILFGGWYSNQAAGNNPYRNPDVSSVRYIDDIAVSTTRIGCLP
jgi:hypothetical protein